LPTQPGVSPADNPDVTGKPIAESKNETTPGDAMKKFHCIIRHSITGREIVIGGVEAIDGDTAWALARAFQPNVEYLKEVN